MKKPSLWTRFTNLFSKTATSTLEPMPTIKVEIPEKGEPVVKHSSSATSGISVTVKTAEIVNEWPDNIETRHKLIKDLGETVGWQLTTYRPAQKHMAFEFEKDNKLRKINVYLGTMTVTETITSTRTTVNKKVTPNALGIMFMRLKQL